MSHRPVPPPSRGSRAPPTSAGDTPPPTPRGPSTLAAPKPVRPQNMLQPPMQQQWTAQPSPPGYTSFPPPPSPAPNAGGPPTPSGVPAAASPAACGPTSRSNLRSPGPNALTSFPPPPPPPPPQRDGTSYFPSAQKPAAARVPYEVSMTPEKTKYNTNIHASQTELRPGPGLIDLDNLEETLHNLRFAPSPMLSTIYSVPSTPGEELSTPDFTASTTSRFTPPSTNPTPEPPIPTTARDPITSPTRPRARFEAYALEFASLPPCPRDDEDFVGGRWYGWPGCAVCPACYHEFARGTALAAPGGMPLRGETVPGSVMCEMYSPRMRGRYAEACARGDPAELLRAAGERRRVYFETVPVMREMILEAQAALGQRPGMAEGAGPGAGTGLGFAGEFDGTRAGVLAGEFKSGTRSLVIEQLEKRWREVE